MIATLPILLLHAAVAQPSPADTSEALAFFDHYVERINAHDSAVGELFAHDARITTLRDGSDRFELSGEEWKQVIERGMPLAERNRERISFDDVQVESADGGFRITGRRMSTIQCVTDDQYSLLIGRTESGESGDFEILEEHTTTVSLSECPASAELTEALATVREELLPLLPLDLDEDTRLVDVEVRGRALIYHQQIHTMEAADLDVREAGGLLRVAALREVCGDARMREIADAGATVRYSYMDSDRVHLVNADVTPGVCALLE